MVAAAKVAIAPPRRIVGEVRRGLPSGVTREDQEEAEEAVKAALSQLPVGASERQMEKARETALQPLCAAITERARQRQALSNGYGT